MCIYDEILKRETHIQKNLDQLGFEPKTFSYMYNYMYSFENYFGLDSTRIWDIPTSGMTRLIGGTYSNQGLLEIYK